MPKTQTTIRIEESQYKQAKEILEYIGMSYSQAINVFNHLVVLNKGLPFEAKIPNDETVKAMKDVIENRNCESITIEELEKEFNEIKKT